MSHATQNLLTITNLGKQYRRDFWGVRDLSIQLTPGITGLLGPNGAGKSTLMRMLATITRPSEGQILWNDQDVRKNPDALRRILGYLPQDFGVYPHLNAYEFLTYLAAIKGLPAKAAKKRIDELLVWVNLVDAAKRPLSTYSGGMRQRIGIAQALLNDPLVLIVDEPTVGLDPEERVRFRQLLSDLAQDRIILFSTHIVSDVEVSADRIVLMNKGKVLHQGTPAMLLNELKGMVWEIQSDPQQLAVLKHKFQVTSTYRRDDALLVRLVSREQPDMYAQPAIASLEDAYLFHVNNHQERP
ncbi:MAG: ABC transporter ATP-binding protein [Chloroflexi bacterium HGW-Chloroflexi-10]|nr:MAG: ABC transporter ATP-binding protein [Chloroflexi bacterium HGW-Chloroflexi-10]